MEKHGSNRDRQPKFTNEELAIILGEVSRHKDVMLSRSLDQETSKFKRQFWQDVAAKLNAVNGHSLRTANEMHFKWRDWKSRTMRKVAHYQRVASEGKAVDDKSALSDIEQRLVILLAGTSEDDDSDGKFACVCLPDFRCIDFTCCGYSPYFICSFASGNFVCIIDIRSLIRRVLNCAKEAEKEPRYEFGIFSYFFCEDSF